MLTMGRPLKMGGNAWSYLVDSVAGELAQGADAARYYAGAGTPPGRFLGRGLDGLGPVPGSVKAGDEVSAEMLHRMLAQLADPVTGQALGRLPALGNKAPVAGLAGRSALPALRADDLSDAMLSDVARAAIAARSESTSVFTQPNIYADVERQLHGVLFLPRERARVAERAVELALGMAVKLTPPELSHVPQRFRASDGTSQFAPANTWQYSTADLLAAEGRLLDAGRDSSGPVANCETVAHICEQPLPGRDYAMGADQAVAVEQVVTSGRVCDVLIGPAGTGKTTALAGLLVAWEAEHGSGSVKGLAPSASAAATLADELGIATENTAKWLAELDREAPRVAEAQRLRDLADHLPAAVSGPLTKRLAELEAEIGRWQLKPGDLVVVDEASLGGTFALDRLTAQARQAEAKVLFVGDWAQLGAVGAGGAFSMLVEDREMPPELAEVHRFHELWEKQASTELRAGSAAAVDAYLRHGRVAGGDRDEMLAACYRGWKTDVEAGQASLMIAQDLYTVTELNRLARADRVAAAKLPPEGSPYPMVWSGAWATSWSPARTTGPCACPTGNGSATGTALWSRPPTTTGP
jgi:hypothetical protein